MYIETQFCFRRQLCFNGKKFERQEMSYQSGHTGQRRKDPVQICTDFRHWPVNAFISKQARNVAKLMTVQSPHVLLSDLAQGMANDLIVIKNLLYPFGALRTAIYANAVLPAVFLLPRWL